VPEQVGAGRRTTCSSSRGPIGIDNVKEPARKVALPAL